MTGRPVCGLLVFSFSPPFHPLFQVAGHFVTYLSGRSGIKIIEVVEKMVRVRVSFM